MAGSRSSAAEQLIQNLVKISASEASARGISQTTIIQTRGSDAEHYAIDSDDWYPDSTVTDRDVVARIEHDWVSAQRIEYPGLEGIVHEGDIEGRGVLDFAVEEGKVILGSSTNSSLGCAVAVSTKRTIIYDARIE